MPSHRGHSPPTQPHFPSASYSPILLHSAVLLLSKAARYGPQYYKRKNETYRQYSLRIEEQGLWLVDAAKEALLIWLDTYESVRFGGYDLTEGEFIAIMKLVYFLLMEMRPPDQVRYGLENPSSSSSSSYSLGSASVESLNDGGSLLQVRSARPEEETEFERVRSRVNVLRQMETILGSRQSVDLESLSSLIDHGSIFENVIDREERERRMRGGRLGDREGSVIYYDVDE
jgi:hypothetical protein